MEYTRIALRGEKNRVALAPKKVHYESGRDATGWAQVTNLPLTEWELVLLEKALELANESIEIHQDSLNTLLDKIRLA